MKTSSYEMQPSLAVSRNRTPTAPHAWQRWGSRALTTHLRRMQGTSRILMSLTP
ncbi:hypothetical protein [Dyella sp.]|uniref:hypothetical protein n=1 Tax=Dyella sp. TaxID=1869338 RepID=UPI002D803B92|nr:hypothetical protein [Dyella sp.]